MARRYSGSVTVDVTWVDADSQYRCRVRAPGGATTVHVGPPAVLERAVDSPEAYDVAAHAALSFVAEGSLEEPSVNEHATGNVRCDGWHIGRSLAQRYPAAPASEARCCRGECSGEPMGVEVQP